MLLLLSGSMMVPYRRDYYANYSPLSMELEASDTMAADPTLQLQKTYKKYSQNMAIKSSPVSN